MTGLSIVIMDLVELIPNPTVSASTVIFLLHPNQFRTDFIYVISNMVTRRIRTKLEWS